MANSNNNKRHGRPDYPYELLQWRRERTGDSYQEIATRAKISLNAAWKIINGKTDPSASTLKRTFTAMGLNHKYALCQLDESQFRRAVVLTAR